MIDFLSSAVCLHKQRVVAPIRRHLSERGWNVLTITLLFGATVRMNFGT
jgi:hypothetical protein